MSHWADYQKERFGWVVLEEDWGFLAYSISHPFLAIQDIYVVPEMRRGVKGLQFLNRASQIARESGCTHLWTQVWINDSQCSRALRANLACGFEVLEADGGRIILIKEIGG